MISIHDSSRPPYVEFKQVSIPDKRESERLGYHVTKDVNMAFVMQPGSRDVLEKNAEDWLAQIKRKVMNADHDAYKAEWVDQYHKMYEMWKAGQEAPPNGTHVKEWPQASPAQVQNMIALRIITVEDVAAMTEDCMARLGLGARELKEKAKDWLAKRELASGALKENEQLKAEVSSLQTQVEELLLKVKELSEPKKRGPKPKKVEAENA